MPDKNSIFSKAIKDTFRSIIPISGMSLAISVLLFGLPLYMMQVYDRVLGSQSVETLIYLSIACVFSLTILSMIEGIRIVILGRVGAAFEAKIAGPLFVRYIALNAKSGERGGGQGLQDLNQLRNFISGPTLPVLVDLLLIPIFMIVVFLIHPALGALTLGGSLVLVFLACLHHGALGRQIRGESDHARKAQRRAHSFLDDAEIVHSLGLYPNVVRNWGEENAKAVSDGLQESSRGAAFQAASKFVRLTLQVALLGVGAYLTLQHQITGGMIFATSLIAGRALQPIDGMLGAWRNILHAHQSYLRLSAIFDGENSEERKLALPAPQGKLTVENVAYQARSTHQFLLSNISFELLPGKSLGVVGAAGAGKSTLARLIIGAIEPSSGVIRLDGADVRHWNRDEIGEHLGYLPQTVEFFPGTIAQNIARMSDTASDEEIVRAAQLAGAHDMILRLPQGYSTYIGTDTRRLSGGQKQRIGLARAFFGSPKLLVLDEPNANLDAEGDKALYDAIRSAKAAGTTVVIIAQRPSAIEAVDLLMVLQAGRIAKFGSRQEILAQLLPRSTATPVINIKTSRPRSVTGAINSGKPTSTLEECLARIKHNITAGRSA